MHHLPSLAQATRGLSRSCCSCSTVRPQTQGHASLSPPVLFLELSLPSAIFDPAAAEMRKSEVASDHHLYQASGIVQWHAVFRFSNSALCVYQNTAVHEDRDVLRCTAEDDPGIYLRRTCLLRIRFIYLKTHSRFHHVSISQYCCAAKRH